MKKTYAYGSQESVFTGTMFGLLGINLASSLIIGITFGIAYPWVLCWKESWYKEHTYINGRQLRFTGTGAQLIGNWLKWMLLSFITFGIYSLWVPVKIEQWTVSHTCFSDAVKYMPTPETSSPLGEWFAATAATVKAHAQHLWKKLRSWIRDMRTSRTWECFCGHHNNQNDRFCTACGQPQWRESTCPNCGARLSPNVKFCGICAYPIHRQ